MPTRPSIDEQLARLARRCERILTEADLRAKLAHSERTGRPLRVKFGMDPTAPDVTLGHCVPLKVIRQFQEWGHTAVLIVGDYTAGNSAGGVGGLGYQIILTSSRFEMPQLYATAIAGCVTGFLFVALVVGLQWFVLRRWHPDYAGRDR